MTEPRLVEVKGEQGYGRVVLTSSVSGILGNFGQSKLDGFVVPDGATGELSLLMRHLA